MWRSSGRRLRLRLVYNSQPKSGSPAMRIRPGNPRTRYGRLPCRGPQSGTRRCPCRPLEFATAMSRLKNTLSRLFTTPYRPQPEVRGFLDRLETQQAEGMTVSVSVLDARESEQRFGVPMARRGIQPVYSAHPQRLGAAGATAVGAHRPELLHARSKRPAANHFSIAQAAFGLWPHRLVGGAAVAAAASGAAEADHGLAGQSAGWTTAFARRRFICGRSRRAETREGFVFTPLDAGTKVVHVCLQPTRQPAGPIRQSRPAEDGRGRSTSRFRSRCPALTPTTCDATSTRSMPVDAPRVDCDVPTLVNAFGQDARRHDQRQRHAARRSGQPGRDRRIRDAVQRVYRPLGRKRNHHAGYLLENGAGLPAGIAVPLFAGQPVALCSAAARTWPCSARGTVINERLHLRLWLTPLRYEGKPVWVGQISRDIGVRFTTKAWNLTTHRIDPDIDEAARLRDRRPGARRVAWRPPDTSTAWDPATARRRAAI